MAVDTQEKRMSAATAGRPWARAKLAAGTIDEQARISIGLGYGGNALSPGSGGTIPVVVHHRMRNMGFQGFLKQSTAVDVLIGPFVDSTDGDTEETGLTISQADVLLSKNGQAAAQKNDATACVHDADGYYNCELDATDTNTVGQLTLLVHETGALAVRLDYHVVEEAVYDAMYGASAAGPLQSTTAGRTLDVTATGAAGIDWGNVENPTTPVDLSGTDIQLCDTITTYTGNTVQTGDAFARLGAPAGASVSADISTVDTVVDGIQTDLDNGTDGLGAIKTAVDGAATQAEVASEISDALTVDTIADSYATDGSQPTIAQALLMIQQFLMERSVSGTTVTVTKPDGSTSAMTFTLNDATTPTSITRAS